ESQKNAERGVQVASEVGEILREIGDGVEKVTELISTVSEASAEQARGIDQINQSVGQMDIVAQTNSDSAQESVAISEELSTQAADIGDMVKILTGVVGAAHVEDHVKKSKRILKKKRGVKKEPDAGPEIKALAPVDESDDFQEF
ncbi:MAG: methyl-accepting chemotaxis protein, partial [Desulfobacterales bacterium]|nr:methyl-accepting chemotaxis protein [Desulfobacterales bacterium]